MNVVSVMLSVSVDVNTPDITPPFPFDRFNFSNAQLVSSVTAEVRERSEALSSTDSITGVVSSGATLISLRISF